MGPLLGFGYRGRSEARQKYEETLNLLIHRVSSSLRYIPPQRKITADCALSEDSKGVSSKAFACRPCSSGSSRCTHVKGRSNIFRDLLHCFNLDGYAEADYKMFFRCFLASIRSTKSRSLVVGPTSRRYITYGLPIHIMAPEPMKKFIRRIVSLEHVHVTLRVSVESPGHLWFSAIFTTSLSAHFSALKD